MGETGPCGPCSEIHIDLGTEMCDMKTVPGHKCRVNAGCARYIELWNLVFIQFNRLPEDKLVPLSARYVDTGAGLERIVAVLQNKKSNYDTDLFMPIINCTSDTTGHKYTSKLGNKTDNAFRVIADHIRSLVFAITDGAIPSNEGRGYVIRRILRRASRFGRELGMHEPFIYKLVPVVVDCLGDAFGEITERADYVSTVIESEETGFGTFMAALANTELPVTEDAHKYDTDSCDSKLIGWLDNGGFKNQGRIETGAEVGIILDRTCFYAEAGGQAGDCGIIKSATADKSDNAQFIVEATAKIANCIIHQGKVVEGPFSIGQNVKAIISKDRAATKKNHTATHLLQWALQEVLGKSVAQQGSYVGPDYLRFDFTYPKAPTTKELKKVEDLVREKIAADLPLTCVVMPRSEAEKLGAMALFGEKYGNEVRVVAIGAANEKLLEEAFSREFCGGTHCDNTGQIGGFKIIKEESISAGVRRITALTGIGLNACLEKASDIVDELSATLKVPSEALVDRVGQLIKDNKKLSKELKSAAKASGSDVMAEAKQLLQKCEKIGGTSIIIGQLHGAHIEQAREAIDMLKKKAKSAAIVLGFGDDDKATLLAGMTDDLIKKGLKAGDILKAIAPIIDGGGGGRPQMAQAGGKNPKKINDALKKAAELIKEKLTNT